MPTGSYVAEMVRGAEDYEAAERATQTMMKMKKIDIAALEAAFAGN